MVSQFNDGLFIRPRGGDETAVVLDYTVKDKPFPDSWKEFKFNIHDHIEGYQFDINPDLHGVIHVNRKDKHVLLYTPMRVEYPESHVAILMLLRARKEIHDTQGWSVFCRQVRWTTGNSSRGDSEDTVPNENSLRVLKTDEIKFDLIKDPTFGYMLVPCQEGPYLDYKFKDKNNISFYWMGETIAYAELVDPADGRPVWDVKWLMTGNMSNQPKNQFATLKAQLLTLIDKLAMQRLSYVATSKFVLRDFPSLGVMLIPDPAGQVLELTMGVGDQEGSINICFGGTDMGWIYWNKRAELDVEWRMPGSVCSDTIKAQLLTIVKNGDLYPTQPF